jgi:hypothetical protein
MSLQVCQIEISRKFQCLNNFIDATQAVVQNTAALMASEHNPEVIPLFPKKNCAKIFGERKIL